MKVKSYTNIEQSRKLAEILPLESADMWWNYYSVTTDFGTPQIIHLDTPWVGSFNWYNEPDNIPCWSLAALLSVLNKSAYFANENEAGIAELSSIKATKWCVSILNCGKIKNCYADNPIDACYEMIIRLNELNML